MSCLVGCAAQRAYRVYTTAQEAYAQAREVRPKSVGLKEARLHLEAGKTYLDEARYDRAIESFERSKINSNAILAAHIQQVDQRQKLEAKKEIRKMEVERSQAPPPAAKPKKESQAEVYEARGLPKEALARYLAMKKGQSLKVVEDGQNQNKTGRSSEAAQEISAAKNSAKKASHAQTSKEDEPKPVQRNVEGKKEEVAAKVEPKPAVPKTPRRPIEDDSKKVAKKVVVAPAERRVKEEPKKKAEPNEEEEPPVLAAPAAKKSPDRNLRRIPGRVPFVSQDPSLQPEAMGTLNQVSKFLLENPSLTLVLKGKLAKKEAPNYVDARYESIRSYLTGKGVPEDQIRLDDERMRGKIAEFELFVIEH